MLVHRYSELLGFGAWMEPSSQHLPPSVKYIYVVMARSKGGQGLACGFRLLPNKRAETNQLMLSKICWASWQRQCSLSVLLWFWTICLALAALAPTVKRRGCQFHYSRKAHNSKLGDLGLKVFYNGDVEFNKLVPKVYALSYVPVEDVVKVYKD